MKLTIKTLKQTSFTVDAEPSDTIRNVKEHIEATKGDEYYADGLKLIFSGKILVDAQTVAEYAIKETDFIVAMPGKPRAAAAPVAPAPVAVAPPTPVTPAVAPAPTQAPPAPAVQAAAFPEATVTQLTDMGFPRDQAIAALRAAFGNADRAVDYLMGGAIPAGADFGGADLGEEEAGGDEEDDLAEGEFPELPADSPLQFLLQNEQFTQLRGMIQQQPELLPAILQQLGQANPQLVQLINDNREDFQALLNAPIAPAGGAPQARPNQIQVTAAEHAAIERLAAMGFDRNLVVQAYFACDKNEELAANYLLEHGFE